jgi:hypothetical protein
LFFNKQLHRVKNTIFRQNIDPTSKSYNLMTRLVGVDADGDAEGPGQPEVCDLDGAVAIDEQVLRLQVAVQDTALTTVR